MATSYWRKVLKRAWSKTIAPLGWTKEKITGIASLVIGTAVLGGAAALLQLVTPFISTIVGLLFVGIALFVWAVIETQAAINQELVNERDEHKRKIGDLENKVWNSRPAPPDYDKWKHKNNLSLRTAAQLWEGERPGMKLIGATKETYEMLHGAVQSGALALELDDPSIDPRMQEASRRLKRLNPNAETLVTRQALKAFALANDYDPDFLKD
jgi:hypothetical protein